MLRYLATATSLSLSLLVTGTEAPGARPTPPGSRFDLREWKITLPADEDGDGKIDEVDVQEIQTYVHLDYFHLDADGRVVFVAPNRARTTPGSSNTRSELRHMLRRQNTRVRTGDPANNFALEARKDSEVFGMIGGKLEATLRVDHVPVRALDSASRSACSVVVGQIHAVERDTKTAGFGWGNEPLKIFYKKLPGHRAGSVFWTYERNLSKSDPNRVDIAFAVFGNEWSSSSDPGDKGINLGEQFSYSINVHRDSMYLTFHNERLGIVRYRKSLIDNVDANGVPDLLDHQFGYRGDSFYFKAGAYNQCSTRTDSNGAWVAGCSGSGDWKVDKVNGDYAQVSFSKLIVGPSTPEE